MTDDITVFFAELGIQNPGYIGLGYSGYGEIGESNVFINKECAKGKVVIDDGYGTVEFFAEDGMQLLFPNFEQNEIVDGIRT